MSIRSTVKAIIINDNKVLLNRCFDENNGYYYSLPGGGQNQYETLHDAIIRECLEETGYNIVPLRFSGLYEEICDDPKIREIYPEYAHKMYHIFVCKLKDNILIKPTEIDDMQIDSEWINIDKLSKIRLMPEFLNNNIVNMINNHNSMFYGSDHILYCHA